MTAWLLSEYIWVKNDMGVIRYIFIVVEEALVDSVTCFHEILRIKM